MGIGVRNRIAADARQCVVAREAKLARRGEGTGDARRGGRKCRCVGA